MPPVTFEYRGTKTLYVLLILRLIPAFVILIGLLAVAAFFDELEYIVGISEIFTFLETIGIGVFFIVAGLSLVIALIEYYSVSISVEENSFHIKEGIIHLRELSISYRQIQNIDIARPLIYRLFGVSRVIIITAGNEDNDREVEKEHDKETEAIIDYLDKAKAEKLQHELLERSHVQVVSPERMPAIDLHTH
jgi:uncharacterized membrane protein YdbT with pleckstrin-like domain